MKKRIVCFLLCIVMAAGLLPMSALAAPLPELTASIEGDTLSWTAFEGAGTYAFTVGNGGGYVDGTSLNLKEKCYAYGLADGEITIKLIAYDKIYGQPISATKELVYSYTSKGTLAAPANLRWSGKLAVSWDKVTNADNYVVMLYRLHVASGDRPVRTCFISGTGVDFTTYTDDNYPNPLTAPVPGESYKVEVYARSTNGYAPSSSTVLDWTILKSGSFGKLQNCTLTGSVLSWDAYPGAGSYYVYYGNAGEMTDSNSIDLKTVMDKDGMADGSYAVRVVAYDMPSHAGGTTISEVTDACNYTYTGNGPLAAVTNLTWEDFTCKWDAVAGASRYAVSLYRKSVSETDPIATVTGISGISYKFYSEPVPGETYFFTVYAMGENGYSNGPASTSPEKTFPTVHSLTLTQPVHGEAYVLVDGVKDPERVKTGETVNVSVEVDPGYAVTAIKLNGSPIVGDSFAMPDENVTLSFEEIQLTPFKTAYADLAVPVNGGSPIAADTMLTDAAEYTVTVESCTQSGGEAVTAFSTGTTYSYYLVFRAKSGYVFSSDKELYVNGLTPNIVGGDLDGRSYFVVRMELTAVAGATTVISSAACLMTKPKADASTAAITLISAEPSKYTVEMDEWHESGTDQKPETFAAANYYYFRIKFTPKEGYSFANDAVFTVNGAASDSYHHNTATSPEYWTRTIEYCAERPALTGTLTLTGEAKYDETLTAALTDTNATGLVTYTWTSTNTAIYTDGIIAENSSCDYHSLTEHDIGTTITVTVRDSDRPGSLTVVSKTIEKADGPAAPAGFTAVEPSAPGAADGKLLRTGSDWEYSTDPSFTGAISCSYPETTGLSAGTYYIREKATATRKAGAAATVVIPQGRTLVSAAAITMDRPIGGASSFIFPSSAAPEKYSVVIDTWYECSSGYPRPDTFTAPYRYYYRFRLTPKAGYRLNSSTTVSLNGNPTSTYSYNPTTGELTVYKELEAGYLMSATVADIDFGTEALDYSAVAKNVEITNTSEVALTDPVLTITDSADAFVFGVNSVPGMIAAGDTCTQWYVKPKTGLAAGTYTATLTLTATDLDPAVTATVSFKVLDATRQATPGANFNATGADTGTLSDVESGMQYKIDSGVWVDITSDADLPLTDLAPCTISVIRRGDNVTTVDSAVQQIEITRASKPTPGKDPCDTVFNNNGKIYVSDISETKPAEYRKGTEGDWTSFTSSPTGNLTPGTYFVRIKAKGTVLASEAAEVEIKAYETVDLTGSIEIQGNQYYGGTVLACPSDTPYGMGLSFYRWYRNDTLISGATDSSYVITEADIGQSVTVRLSCSKFTGDIRSAAIVPTKAANTDAMPAIGFTFTADDPDYGKLTGTTTAMEYSFDGGESWSPCTGADHLLTAEELENIAPADGIKLRYAESACYLAGGKSLWASVSVSSALAVQSASAADCSTYGGSDGQLKNLPANQTEYSKDGGAWIRVSGDSVSGLTAGTYSVRRFAKGQTQHSDAVTLVIRQPAETPAAAFTATGADTGILSGLTEDMAYSTDGGILYAACTDASAALTDLDAAKGIKVKRIGNGTTTLDSAVQSIALSKAVTPTLSHTDCTTNDNNNGTVSGVNDTMEYCRDGGDWIAVGGGVTVLTGLTPGTYDIRVKAAGTVLASEVRRITVAGTFGFTPTRSGTTVTVTVSNLTGKTPVLVAEYTGGKMTALHTYEFTEASGSRDFTVAAASDVKCFLVTKTGLVPLTAAVDLPHA